MTDTTSTQENTSDATPVSLPHFVGGEPFFALKKVTTYTATAKKDSHEYIRANAKRKIPRLNELRGFMEVKGKDNPIILVGGGPSLKRPEVLAELREMAAKHTVMACGSSHDWLISQEIIPNCAAIVDPDPITINYFQKLQGKTVYLVASQCHPDVFDHLRFHKVAMWHCYGPEDDAVLSEVEPGFFGIGGGCTIGMRALSIALVLGYSNIHMFGFDSCLDTDDSDHAYPLSSEREMLGLTGESGKIWQLKLGLHSPSSKTYKCFGYQMAQLWHFHDYYKLHYNMFTPTVHGGGPMAEIVEIVKKEIATGLERGEMELVDVSKMDMPPSREITPCGKSDYPVKAIE